MSRCKKSNPINSMREENVRVLSDVYGRVFGVLSLMHIQILVTKYLTSSYILGKKRHSFISYIVRSYPKCPMPTCNSLNTNGFSLLVNITWLFSLPFL